MDTQQRNTQTSKNFHKMHCQNKINFCKVKMCECDYVGKEDKCSFHKIDCGGDNVPTFAQWIGIYGELSEKRHRITGQLEKTSRNHIIASLCEFVKIMEFSMNDKVSSVTRKTLQEFCNRITDVKDISKKAKVQKIQQCFARWIRYETEDSWVIPKIDIPEIKDDSAKFTEPPQELLLKILVWYRSLYGKGHGTRLNKEYLFVTMMLHYAMRNGDCSRLKWSNIKMIDGKPRLEYVPHKTRLSSKRSVKIWMSMLDYYDFMQFRERLRMAGRPCGDDDAILGGGKNLEMQNRLNKGLRGIGVNTPKGLYICRKICIHETYKFSGKEAAIAISGDNFNTISNHYADIGAIEITPPRSICF